MANSVSHAALPFPVKKARFTIIIPYLDADGDPTDPTTPDTERSIDGAAFADCTEEATTITGSNGEAYITLTGDEMNGSLIGIAAKVASGPKATLAWLQPRVLPILQSGTAQAGAVGSITLSSGASAIDDEYIGCIVRTTGGTGGGGGSGSLNNQARVITDYVGSTKVATVEPNWETSPDGTTTYEVLLTDMASNAQRALKPTVQDRTLDVSTGGEAGLDWANIGSPTTTQNLSGTSTKALEPTVAGRTLDVDASGGAEVGSITATPLADIKTQVTDALNVDTYTEIGQETPAATQTIRKMVGYLYKAWRNRSTQTSTQYSLYNDDTTTLAQKATVSDDGTTFDKGEVATGP